MKDTCNACLIFDMLRQLNSPDCSLTIEGDGQMNGYVGNTQFFYDPKLTPIEVFVSEIATLVLQANKGEL